MTTKQGRDKVLEIWSTPLPNEDKDFKLIRLKILDTLRLLCGEIDELESRLNELQPQLN